MQPVNLLTLMFGMPELPAAPNTTSAPGAQLGKEFMLALQQQLWLGQSPRSVQSSSGLTQSEQTAPAWFNLELDAQAVPSGSGQATAAPALNLASLLELIAQQLQAILPGATAANLQTANETGSSSGNALGLDPSASEILGNWDALMNQLQAVLEQAGFKGLRFSSDAPQVSGSGQTASRLPWAFAVSQLGAGTNPQTTADDALTAVWLKAGDAVLPESVKWFALAGGASTQATAQLPGLNLGPVQALELQLADGQLLRIALAQIPSDQGQCFDLRLDLPEAGETITARLTITPAVNTLPQNVTIPVPGTNTGETTPVSGEAWWASQLGSLQPVANLVTALPGTSDATVSAGQGGQVGGGSSDPALAALLLTQSLGSDAPSKALVNGNMDSGWLSLGGLQVTSPGEAGQVGITSVPGVFTGMAGEGSMQLDPRALRPGGELLFGPGSDVAVAIAPNQPSTTDQTVAQVAVQSGSAAVWLDAGNVKQTAELERQLNSPGATAMQSDGAAIVDGSYLLTTGTSQSTKAQSLAARLFKPGVFEVLQQTSNDQSNGTRTTGAASGVTADLSNVSSTMALPYAGQDALGPQLLQFADSPFEIKPFQGLQYQELAQRLLSQAAAAKQSGDGLYSARLALNPPNLGQMYANISVRGETVAVQLAMVSSVPKEQLKDSLDALRQSLEQAGLEVVELRIVTLDPDQQQQSGQRQREPQPDESPDEISKTAPAVSNSVKSTPAVS